MGHLKREGVGKMRYISRSGYVCLCVSSTYGFQILFILALCCVAGSPASKRVPETYFKSYAYESCPGFSLPQNVTLYSLFISS